MDPSSDRISLISSISIYGLISMKISMTGVSLFTGRCRNSSLVIREARFFLRTPFDLDFHYTNEHLFREILPQPADLQSLNIPRTLPDDAESALWKYQQSRDSQLYSVRSTSAGNRLNFSHLHSCVLRIMNLSATNLPIEPLHIVEKEFNLSIEFFVVNQSIIIHGV